MAVFLRWIKKCRASLAGRIVEALVYAAMLLAVLSFFTGGSFLCERF